MFDHAERNDVVERLVHVAIILQTQFDWQSGAKLLSERELFFGDRDADDLRAILFRGEFRKTPPAAADVENALAGLQADLTAHQIEFRFLRFVQTRGVFPVSAGIRQPFVQHRFVQVIARIIVPFPDHEGATFALSIGDAGADGVGEQGDARTKLRLDVLAQQTRQALVQRRAVPPAIHVCLAEAQGAIRQHTGIEAFVVNLDVPRTVTVDTDIRAFQEFLDTSTQSHTRLCRRGHTNGSLRTRWVPALQPRCVQHHGER